MECTVTWTGATGTRSNMGFVAETGSGHTLAMDGAPDTATRFLAAVGAALPLATLPPQQDLDTLDDVRALLASAPQGAAQARLWELLAELARR